MNSAVSRGDFGRTDEPILNLPTVVIDETVLHIRAELRGRRRRCGTFKGHDELHID
jgi:hypothetical protein